MNGRQLPPGQKETKEFSRYGLLQYANRIPLLSPKLEIAVIGDVANPLTLTADSFNILPRIKQVNDFHCVTTWTKMGVQWSGFRFSDFYQKIVIEQAKLRQPPKYVIFRAQDRYRTFFLLEDLLADDVLLADQLYGEPLNWEHGAPMRLVAPAHYGFRSAKHLISIEFCQDLSTYRSPFLHWFEHSRARVAYEERGRWLPTVFYRYFFRAVISVVRWYYRRARSKFKDTNF